MQALYLPDHDRITLRINTKAQEQMALWLTRRLLHGLYPVLQERDEQIALDVAVQTNPERTKAHSPEAQHMLAEIKREAVLKHADFATPFQQQAKAQPLGAEPLLVTKVDITHHPADGAHKEPRITLHFQREEPGQNTRGLKVDCNPKTYHGLMELLRNALKKADWGIPIASPLPLLPERGEEGEPPVFFS